MRVTVITPPEPVVSLVDAKKHLRIEPGVTDDDAYIEGLISAAIVWLDGPAGWLGRALGKQTLELRIEGFGCYPGIDLPFPPLVSVESVKYLDVDEVAQTVDEDLWLVQGQRLWLKPTFSAPAVSRQPDPVIIRYVAGYGSFDTADPPVWTSALPKSIWVAVLMLVGQWFDNRQAVTIGAAVEQMPFAVDALLGPFRVYR